MHVFRPKSTKRYNSSRKEAREGKNGKRGLTIAAT
jgi:hypothetical protein